MFSNKSSRCGIQSLYNARDLTCAKMETLVRTTEDICSGFLKCIKSLVVGTRTFRQTDAHGDFISESRLCQGGPQLFTAAPGCARHS